MTKLDLLVRNAHAVIADQTVWCDIGISAGRIATITPWSSDKPVSSRTLDADGRWVIPGAIDTHAHIGQVAPEYEDREGLGSDSNFLWESRAALSGGLTTALNYLKFGQGPMLDTLHWQRESAEKHCLIDVLFHGYIMNDMHMSELDAAIEHGIRSFKIFLPYRGEEARSLGGISSLNYGELQLALRRLSSLGGQALIHAEDGDIVEISTRDLMVDEGGSLHDWEASRPTAAEGTASFVALYLARRERCRVTIVHVSSKEAVEARRSFPDVDATLESCPHYLTLCVEDGLGPIGKVAPPIRHRVDVDALWTAVQDREITFFGSDHNVWPQDAKCTVWTAKAGLPGIDLLLPLLLTKGHVERGLSLPQIVELTSTNAARRFGLYPQKGTIQVGADADLVILESGSKHIRAAQSSSAVDYSPYEGTVLKMWPHMTVKGGKIAFDGVDVDDGNIPRGRILNDSFVSAASASES
ncbi:MAG: amidohydrolase family protein [Actinomycetota bacterium]|nr:amidohydrolase family protein [Actinomycetota bacterium]